MIGAFLCIIHNNYLYVMFCKKFSFLGKKENQKKLRQICFAKVHVDI